jgi:predicted transcriptional regulator
MPRKTPPKLWPKAIEVYEILRNKDATWTELGHEMNISGTSLADVLEMLQNRGLIFHRNVDGKYCNLVRAYEGLDPKLTRYTTLSDDPESFREIVEAFRTKKDTQGFEEKAIRVNVNAISGSISALIHDSLGSGRNAHQRLDDLIELFIRPQTHALLGLCLLNKELGERVTRQMRDRIFEQFSKEFDKYNEAWKEFTRS